MESYVEKSSQFEQTKNARDLLGIKVLSMSGEVLGKVLQVQLHEKTNALEGIICKRAMFRKPSYNCYFCEKYIDRITHDAIILNIEPALVWVGHKVVSNDGKVLGKITNVNRVNDTNAIDSLLFKRFFFKTVRIPIGAVKQLGKSVVVKKDHADIKKNGFE